MDLGQALTRCSPLRAGEDSAMMMAGPLHPPCRRKKLRPLRPRLTARTALCSVPSSSPHAAGRAGAPVFLPEENEKTGRARSKREKEVTGDATGARLNERRSRNDFPRAIRLSGGLSRDEWTSSSFCCRTPVVAGESRLPDFFFGACQMSGSAPLAAIFGRLPPCAR